MTDRAAILRRIRALRQMTEGRGCTEDEAMSAAGKAAQLMREYGLDEHDVELDWKTETMRQSAQSEWSKLWQVVGYVTNTAVCQVAGSREVIWTGRAPGPEIASYLTDVTTRAIERAQRRFRLGKFFRARRTAATRRAALADFRTAMILRLCSRLLQLFEGQHSKTAIEAARAAQEARFGHGEKVKRKERKERFFQAGWEGHRAGNEVSLSHGVAASAEPARIGARP